MLRRVIRACVSMKLVVQSVPDIIIITQDIPLKPIVCMQSAFYVSLHLNPVCSPLFAFYTDDFLFDCQQSGSEV